MVPPEGEASSQNGAAGPPSGEQTPPQAKSEAPAKEPPPAASGKPVAPETDSPAGNGGETGDAPSETMGKSHSGDGLFIAVSEDNMTAQLKGAGEVEGEITLESVKSLMEEMGIMEGIVEDSLVKAFINSEIFREKPFVVARGNPGNPGRDSVVTYHFDVDHLKAGTDRSDGAIDFRDRGKIPHVKEGDLIAERTPGILTEHGVDIYGHAVIYPEAANPPFESGTNTELSEDGFKIFAKTDGQPMVSFGGRISIASELVIPGDVNYETGHVDFEGNIVVRGTIQEGFRVKGANLTAKEASGAEIDVTGDVTITGGLNTTTVKAGGNIKALFTNNAVIESYGDLQVTKEILESTVNISGACVVTRGKIISSTVTAKLGIESRDIGTERSTPCKLSVGVDEHAALKIRDLSNRIEQINEAIQLNREELEKLAEADRGIQAGIAQNAHTQDRSQLEIKTLNESLAEFEKEGKKDKVAEAEKQIAEFVEKAKKAEEELNTLFDNQDANMERADALKAEIAGLEKAAKSITAEKDAIVSWEKKLKGNSSVMAYGKIFPGTLIAGSHSRRFIKDALNNVRFREVLTGSGDSGDEWEMRIV